MGRKCPKHEEGSSLADALSASDTEEVFSALMRSDIKALETPRPSLPPDARVKFRTQFNVAHEGSLVEYALYRVFEEVKLSGQNESVRDAHRALEALLKVHCPGSITMEAIPFLSGGVFRSVFGKDAQLDDFQIGSSLRCFLYAKNQLGTAETMRALLLALMREQLVVSTTVVLMLGGCAQTLLTDGDKYILLREAVVQSKGVDWLNVLPRYLWPDEQKIPVDLHAPDSDETLLGVWVEKSRALNKLMLLLHTQRPTEAIKSRFITVCTPMFRRRLDEMAAGEAKVYIACTQCYALITNALIQAKAAEKAMKAVE